MRNGSLSNRERRAFFGLETVDLDGPPAAFEDEIAEFRLERAEILCEDRNAQDREASVWLREGWDFGEDFDFPAEMSLRF
jgi:hypothetical protein